MPSSCQRAVRIAHSFTNLSRRGLTCDTVLLGLVLIGAATLGGCSEGVLDPKGPIAVAERQILFNSLGIMLAIVIPTILATLGVAFWFRASNTRARYLPDFDYSGRLEMLVWSIPDHDRAAGWRRRLGRLTRPRSAQADRLHGQARHGSGRLARLEMAVHLSRRRASRASISWSFRSARRSASS